MKDESAGTYVFGSPSAVRPNASRDMPPGLVPDPRDRMDAAGFAGAGRARGEGAARRLVERPLPCEAFLG